MADKELVMKYLELTQAKTQTRIRIDNVMNKMLATLAPLLDEDSINKFKSAKEEFNYNILMDKLADVYCEHYDNDTVKALIDFYSTPAGQNVTNKALLVSLDIEKTTERWAEAILKV